ncbi:hypothetical protein FHS01_002861 [Longimicrobium terrae]|uniref:Uncharacterized protein n=1 Tax=Longimicrobium terrae TaxID=1639882 RepID=A0A841GZG6_9BACT|nr:hypothetical protein [Longimicrobium terrae]MBB4636840.1 hypothetical protein [Longimicrobium terrae]MBB6071160.1 hypothetical protein [Longimicrobium terrae]
MIKRVLLAVLLGAACARTAAAQSTRPWLAWRTLRTEHFDVHFPAELEPWAREAASRMEGIQAAVAPLVGSTPDRRVTVVIDDPAGETNGTAWSFLRTPYIQLYPTPPDPRSSLGNSRNYTEQLTLHEFTHIAHLTRPSRDPFTRLRSVLALPGQGPLSVAPRWVKEGYATYVEGRLTGSGRPFSAIRASTIRQFALEGRLPAYGQLDAVTGGYQSGSMAYLTGSAFLEWLAARRGEQSLVDLWRRMSARQIRTFDEAFRGVYGGSPAELYGLFVVEATANALEARRLLSTAGLVAGDTVQHLTWGTGDPSVSADGRHVALPLRGPSILWSRIVVWRTAETAAGDSAANAARDALLRRDSLDVPAIQVWPRPRTPIATLRPAGGLYGYSQPRFMGADQLLVIRSVPGGGGVLRPELFVWNWRRNTIRQVTHNAAIRAADPAPDGKRAAAVQCRNGFCGLVMVDLRTGALTPLAGGTADRVFDRARFSPDGRTVVAAMQEGGRWKIAAVDAAGGPVRVVYDDPAASTYDPAFTADGDSLIVVSEAGGIPNLARIAIAGGAPEPLTRVTGLAVAPDVNRATGDVYFLSLHAYGLDLQRLDSATARPGAIVQLPASLAPAVRRVAETAPDTLARAAVGASSAYGIGPRWIRVLPWGSATAGTGTAGVALHNADPIGRLSLMARGGWGAEGAERGASAGAVWRGMRPSVAAEAFFINHNPSGLGAYADDGFDADYAGAAASVRNAWNRGRLAQEWRAGVSAGRLDQAEEGASARTLAFGRYAASNSGRRGPLFTSGGLALSGSGGQTADERWARGVAGVSLGLGWGALGLRGDASYGRVSGGTPRWERFTVGGAGPLLVDDAVLSQRIAMPALRWGALEGDEVLTWRVSTAFGGVRPYYWAGSTDPDWARWQRMVGVEMSTDFAGLLSAALPSFRATGGVAYGLNGPYRNGWSLYTSLTYTP